MRDERSRLRRYLKRGLIPVGSVVGAALLATSAAASPALLSVGHAYCYYWYGTNRTGGMHLVAAGPRVIAAGPSNYVSGTGGKPQDTVVYFDCVPGPGRAGGDAYVGLPRTVMHLSGGHYVFSRHLVVHGVRHLGTRSRATISVTVTLTGTVSAGVINGVLHVAAPGCLPRPLALVYAGR
jgi:hypothetical protein